MFAEPRTKKPFHESIVTHLEFAGDRDLVALAYLIADTTIPKDHDAIVQAFTKRAHYHHWSEENIVGIVSGILAQKET